MKYRFLIMPFLILVGLNLAAQSIDKPLIKVEYDSVDIITIKMLSSRIKQQRNLALLYKQNPESIKDKDVALGLVKETLLVQYAKSLNIEVDEYSIDQQINQQRKGIEQQAGRKITDKEFERALVQMGVSLKGLKKNLINMELIQKLVRQEKNDMLVKTAKPSESDIKRLFNKKVQAGLLTKPTYIEVSHLYLSTQGKGFSEMKSINDRISQYQKQILAGRKTFEQMVATYSEDKETAKTGGKLGWTSMQDRKLLDLFGENNALDIISLKKGEISQVLESPVGFHILKIVDKIEGGIPKLTDRIHPQVNETYKTSIYKLLLQESTEKTFILAMDELYQELKSEATITYFDKGLK